MPENTLCVKVFSGSRHESSEEEKEKNRKKCERGRYNDNEEEKGKREIRTEQKRAKNERGEEGHIDIKTTLKWLHEIETCLNTKKRTGNEKSNLITNISSKCSFQSVIGFFFQISDLKDRIVKMAP